MRRILLPGVIASLLLAAPGAALAQAESREGIYLQNQILQLRQELEQLRAGGSSLGAPPRAAAPPPVQGGPAQGDLLARLLDRVQALEEEMRQLRGRLDEADFRDRQMAQNLEKLQGDMDYRLQQLEAAQPAGGRPAAPAAQRPAPAAAPARPAPQAGTLQPPPGAQPSAPAAPTRPPERALAEGQTALARHDYDTAEAAAREVLANRNTPRALDAQLLLAEALAGKHNYGAAAVAYDDAYQRSRNGARAPEALNGLAAAFLGLGNKRDACSTLDDLRSNFSTLRGAQAERAAELRRRAGCR